MRGPYKALRRLYSVRNRVLDIGDRRPLYASEQQTLDRVEAELNRRSVRVVRWERAQWEASALSRGVVALENRLLSSQKIGDS